MKKMIRAVSIFMCFFLLSGCNNRKETDIKELMKISEQALTSIAIQEDANIGDYMYTALSQNGELYLIEYHGTVVAQVDELGLVPCDWFGQVLMDSKNHEVIDTYSYHMFFSGITGEMHVLGRIDGDVAENDWGRFNVIDRSDVLVQSNK